MLNVCINLVDWYLIFKGDTMTNVTIRGLMADLDAKYKHLDMMDESPLDMSTVITVLEIQVKHLELTLKKERYKFEVALRALLNS